MDASPRGWLRGRPMVDTFQPISIDLASSAELRERLEAFRRRATDLVKFIRGQPWGIQTINVNRSDEYRPRVSGTIPNELALDGLYRRFRFFILQKEPANYRRFLSLLSTASTSDLLHPFLRTHRKQFLTSDTLDFAFITARSKYRAEEIIDFWFNAYYFHDQQPEKEKLAAFQGIVSAEGAKVVLWETEVTWPVENQDPIMQGLEQVGVRRYSTMRLTHFGRLFVSVCVPEDGFEPHL
jgi:hypothetical protein